MSSTVLAWSISVPPDTSTPVVALVGGTKVMRCCNNYAALKKHP